MTDSKLLSDGSLAESRQTAFERPSHWPLLPRKIADLSIPLTLINDLVLRHLRARGVMTFTSLGASAKLSPAVIETVFEQLRKQQLVQVKGMAGQDYEFELTTAGRNLAKESSEFCNYTGPAPVSLREYCDAIRLQAARVKVNRSRLRAAFSDLVCSDQLLDQLGPALVSQRALFLYGPTGNGKTSYAERLGRVYRDSVVIPYAVEVDGQIIIIHDPVVHRSVPISDKDLDPRWVACQRPLISAGGELVARLLDLQFDEASGAYLAPLQMKANNGMLIIDDFGRQSVSPRELLNRWIVPLDRRVDYLTLSYGLKFEIPFELLVVFATNLEPDDLVEEAFLRRVPNKVHVGAVGAEAFDQIFERVATQYNLDCESGTSEYLRKLCLLRGCRELRACHPGDICRILLWISEYEEQPLRITRTELERAAELYFAHAKGAETALRPNNTTG